MAKVPAVLVGAHACWGCGRDAPVKRTSTGKLHASCDWCGLSHYEDRGTVAYRKLERATTPIADEAPAGTAPPDGEVPAPAAPPEPKKRATWHNPLNPGA